MSEEQPVLHRQLYNFATNRLRYDVEDRLLLEAKKAAGTSSHWVTEAIREAYVSGVQDGYVQGVSAKNLKELEGDAA